MSAPKEPAVLRGDGWGGHITARVREIGRYAWIALIVPGGGIIALALWAFRHRAWLAAYARRTLFAVRALRAQLFSLH